MLSQVEPEVLAAGVLFLLGAIDALRRYRADEKVRLSQLPLLELRAVARFFRRRFFTVDKPDRPSFIVNETVASLTRALGEQGVKPGHSFSYHYSGEIYNGIMYRFDEDKKYPHRQIHIRAFPHVDGLEVLAHEEPHWWHHPVAHVRGGDMEHVPANEWVQRRLEVRVPVGYPSD